MSPEICEKTASETDKKFTLNFTDHLNSGATVSAVSSITASPSGLTFANNTVSSPYVTTKVSGGTNGVDYVVTAVVTTSDGETLEESGLLRVRSSAS